MRQMRSEGLIDNQIIRGSLSDVFQPMAFMGIIDAVLSETFYHNDRNIKIQYQIIRYIITAAPSGIATLAEFRDSNQNFDRNDVIAYWIGYILYHTIFSNSTKGLTSLISKYK
jgi:hypothetical protein